MVPNLDFGNSQGISILIYTKIFFKSQKKLINVIHIHFWKKNVTENQSPIKSFVAIVQRLYLSIPS